MKDMRDPMSVEEIVEHLTELVHSAATSSTPISRAAEFTRTHKIVQSRAPEGKKNELVAKIVSVAGIVYERYQREGKGNEFAGFIERNNPDLYRAMEEAGKL